MCVSPIPVKVYRKDETLIQREQQRNPNNNHPYIYAGYVPCGKCYQCLSYVRLQYQFRMEQEAANSVASYFITFTYSDEFVPSAGVDKTYLKKMVRYLKNDVGLNFTYYGIGEYGTSPESSHRPHYHLMVFLKENYKVEYLQIIFSKAHSQRKNEGGIYTYQPLGFVQMSEITPARIGYITHYHTRPKQPPTTQYKNKTFQILSKGLGSQLFNDVKILDYVKNSPNYIIHNMNHKQVPLPYYYRRKYKIYKDVKTRDNPFYRTKEEVNYVKDLKLQDKIRYSESLKEKDKSKLKKYNVQFKQNYL